MLRHVFIANGSTIYHTDPLSAFLLANNPAVVRGKTVHQLSVTGSLFVGMRVRSSEPPTPCSPFFLLSFSLYCFSSLWVSVFVHANMHMVQLQGTSYSVKSSDALWINVWTKENPETFWLLFVQTGNLQSKLKFPVETWKVQGTVKQWWTLGP